MSERRQSNRAQGPGHMVGGLMGGWVAQPPSPHFRSAAEHAGDLVMVPSALEFIDRRLAVAERWEGVIQSTLADNECEHGALPHDHIKPDGCRCWEPDPDPDPPEAPDAPVRAAERVLVAACDQAVPERTVEPRRAA